MDYQNIMGFEKAIFETDIFNGQKAASYSVRNIEHTQLMISI
jgi:hypothetical protein